MRTNKFRKNLRFALIVLEHELPQIIHEFSFKEENL